MFTKYRLILTTLACLGGLYAPSSFALVQWWTQSGIGSCTSGYGNSCTFQNGMSGTGSHSLTASAWANTSGSANQYLDTAQLNRYSGGLGVTNRDAYYGDSNEGGTPEHATDNNDRFDMILFDFNDLQIALESVFVGWYSNDADISVLAYTGGGAGAPNLDGTDISSATDLINDGWEIVGNYDADANVNGDGNSATIQDSEAVGAIHSSYWLIGAYNPIFGTSCNPTDYCQADGLLDYFKIKDLAGTIVPDDTPNPPNEVPEPGSLLLLASALLITPKLRRSRAAV